jgi:hypothetical protein
VTQAAAAERLAGRWVSLTAAAAHIGCARHVAYLALRALARRGWRLESRPCGGKHREYRLTPPA